jgi:hypothetical protein
MPVGFFLQALLKSLSRPFAAFGHHFLFDLPQRPGARRFCLHPFPFVKVLWWLDEEPFTPYDFRGQCQDAPAPSNTLGWQAAWFAV